ncbi:MAG: fatty acid--CoA ligase family protein, partial [Actinomycetota bacterium]
LGAARSQLVPVLLNPSLTKSEVQSLLTQVDPAMVLTHESQVAALFDAKEQELAPHPRTRPIHFTSGTTGVPKAVTTGLLDERTAAAIVADEQELWGLGPQDRMLMCSPMHHTVAIRFAVTALCSGAELLFSSKFDAATTLQSLRSDAPTAAFMVPTHLQRILGSHDLGPDETFSTLRYLAHAGSACPPSLKLAAMERVGGQGILEFYGATEAQFAFCTQVEWLEHPGTVGRARAGRRLMIDPVDGEDGIGTIWCEVPEFARFSYLGNEEATDAAWRGQACTVGDLGELDDEGFLYLTGRRQDLIITGGVNVYPAEVEAGLSGVSGVTELCVFGVDDEKWGQKVCCAVVGRSEAINDLRELAMRDLAPHKRPKEYFQLEVLPMTSTGKVLRREVASLCGF